MPLYKCDLHQFSWGLLDLWLVPCQSSALLATFSTKSSFLASWPGWRLCHCTWVECLENGFIWVTIEIFRNSEFIFAAILPAFPGPEMCGSTATSSTSVPAPAAPPAPVADMHWQPHHFIGPAPEEETPLPAAWPEAPAKAAATVATAATAARTAPSYSPSARSRNSIASSTARSTTKSSCSSNSGNSSNNQQQQQQQPQQQQQQQQANSQQAQQHQRGPGWNRARDLLYVGWSWWFWWSWCLCLCFGCGGACF